MTPNPEPHSLKDNVALEELRQGKSRLKEDSIDGAGARMLRPEH